MLHKGLRHILKGCLQPKWMPGMDLLIKLLSPIKSGPSKSLKFFNFLDTVYGGFNFPLIKVFQTSLIFLSLFLDYEFVVKTGKRKTKFKLVWKFMT